MTLEYLIGLVGEMRDAQRRFIKSKWDYDFRAMQRAEKRVDRAIEEYRSAATIPAERPKHWETN